MPQHQYNIHATLTHLQHLRLNSHSLAFLCICTPSPCRMLSNRLATQQIVFNALLWTNPWAISLSQSLTFQSCHWKLQKAPQKSKPPLIQARWRSAIGCLHRFGAPEQTQRPAKPLLVTESFQSLWCSRWSFAIFLVDYGKNFRGGAQGFQYLLEKTGHFAILMFLFTSKAKSKSRTSLLWRRASPSSRVKDPKATWTTYGPNGQKSKSIKRIAPSLVGTLAWWRNRWRGMLVAMSMLGDRKKDRTCRIAS